MVNGPLRPLTHDNDDVDDDDDDDHDDDDDDEVDDNDDDDGSDDKSWHHHLTSDYISIYYIYWIELPIFAKIWFTEE